ncbi:MAG: replication-relaxation family protein [Chloroflexota bacterium]
MMLLVLASPQRMPGYKILSERLPRHTRVAPEKRPVFRLTARDGEIIRAVNDCRALQTAQVELLFFSSPKPAYKRLEKLYHHEYLDRHFITQVAHAPAASPIIYTLGKLGAAVLAATYGYTADDFHFASRAVLDWRTLQHILAINQVRVAIERACRDQAIHLLQWQDELTFRAAPDTVWIKNSRGRQSKKPVLPDSYLLIKTPKGEARFFLEVDRGTEGIPQFREQMEVYQEYILSGDYGRRYQSKSLRILVVTTGEQRLHNLRKAIVQVGGGDYYWLTTRDQITPATILTAPIWYKAAGGGLHAILG